jgi:hypothetical protein
MSSYAAAETRSPLDECAGLLWWRSSQELARPSQRIEVLYLLFAAVGQMLISFAKIFLEIGRARVMARV